MRLNVGIHSRLERWRRPKIVERRWFTRLGARHIVVGRVREQKAEDALRELKERGRILGYVKTSPFDFSDCIHGIDFFVVLAGRYHREVVRLSVSGEWRVAEQSARYPLNVVIAVGVTDVPEELRERILDALTQKLAKRSGCWLGQ